MKKIKIFLASSAELREERQLFEIEIYRKCKIWFDKGIFLHLNIWEDLSAKMSETRSQDEYNKEIKQADIFVLLAYTKVGIYTGEEFEQAFGHFQTKQKPFIFTYFKDAPINTGSITPDFYSLLDFKKKISELGHFYGNYKDFNDLWNQFNKELDRLYINGFKEMDRPLKQSDNPSPKTNAVDVTGSNNEIFQHINNSTITDNSIIQTHSGTGHNIAGDYVGGNKIMGNKEINK